MRHQLLCVALGLVLGATGYALAQQATEGGQAGGLKQKVLLEKAVPAMIEGKEAKVTLVELERAPGSAGKSHRHPGPVVVYVLEGELESQVDDQPRKVYRKGDVFYEPSRALHAVSRNPSKDRPVRFLAFLLTAKDAKQLVIPEKR